MRLRWYFVFLALIVFASCGLTLYVCLDKAPALFYAAEGVALAGVLFLILFYHRIMRPINTLSGGLDLLRAQDWNNRLVPVGQKEVDKIIFTFNDMMERLKEERIRYEERTRLVDLLVTAAPVGIVIPGLDRRPTLLNPAARTIFDNQPQVKEFIAGLKPGDSTDLQLPGGQTLRCDCHAFSDRGRQLRFHIIQNISASVSEARREAYEKVIRLIAHEVNNTLGAILSVFDTLTLILPDDAGDVRGVLDSCSDRMNSLGQFIRRFADVVRIPHCELQTASVTDFVRECAPFLQSIGARVGVPVGVKLPDDDLYASFDRVLLEQVLVNVVKNAVESAAATPGGAVTVQLGSAKGSAEITVIDNGAGISAEKATHLFTPFYTDKPEGQGIGLEFCRIVLERHHAGYSLATSPEDSLTRFTITLPRQ